MVAAAADGITRSIGWSAMGDGSITFGFAAPGDTNLDWTIDVLDLANIVGSGKFDSGLAAAWYDGDFNYDGVVDSLDVVDFLASNLFDAGSYHPAGGSVAAVPEPTVAALVGVAAGLTAVALTRKTRATNR